MYLYPTVVTDDRAFFLIFFFFFVTTWKTKIPHIFCSKYSSTSTSTGRRRRRKRSKAILMVWSLWATCSWQDRPRRRTAGREAWERWLCSMWDHFRRYNCNSVIQMKTQWKDTFDFVTKKKKGVFQSKKDRVCPRRGWTCGTYVLLNVPSVLKLFWKWK